MSETNVIELTSTVTHATVYTDRARITRHAATELSEGIHEIRLTGLPNSMLTDSFRVKAFGNKGMRILDVNTFTENYTSFPQENIELLSKQYDEAKLDLKRVEDRIAILDKKREFIHSISLQTSESISKDMEIHRPTVEDWEKVLNFMGNNLSALDQEGYKLLQEQKEKKNLVKKLENDLAKLGSGLKKSRLVGKIKMEVLEGGECRLEVKYQVNNASWHPFYDVRVNSEKKTVAVQYFGTVSQRTGEDWKNVEVRLSTARPNLGKGVSELSEWELDIYRPPVPRPSAKAGGAMRSSARKKSKVYAEIQEEAFMADKELEEEIPLALPGAEVEAGAGASVIFRVPGTSDVPGDGSDHRLLIMEEEFGTEFRFITVPKMEELAYLEAEFKNETDYPFLPGIINVYKDEEFVENSRVPEVKLPGETFHLELGADESIRVKYKQRKESAKEKGLFSKSRHIAYETHITIENLRKTTEQVIVRDLVPVAFEEQINVETTHISPSENPQKPKDELAKGTIEWLLEVGPGEKANCELKFSVDYPRDLRVTGL